MTDTVGLTEAATGDVLGGRYRLLELVGEGGMARVFRAQDLTLDRTVAVKVLRGSADVAARERAWEETRVLANLSYHSLVTLFDAHVAPTGQNYLVMEFIDGPTLRDRIAAGPLPLEEVAGLAVDLAEALHVVHTAGIVHRDVKPSNVLLAPPPLPGREFCAKIADFGIAYLLDARATPPDVVAGTAAYLAPEQVRGATPQPPADIYGLGLVLLEALTGLRAFAPAEGVEAVVMRLAATPTMPVGLPRAWRRLLTRMTERDPADRPTALEVARAASSLREDRTSSAPLPPPQTPDPLAGVDTEPVEIMTVEAVPVPQGAVAEADGGS